MKYIIAVDQSTSGTKVSLFDQEMSVCRSLRKSHRQYYPCPGGVEHDAAEIWNNTAELLTQIVEDIPRENILGIGIANQRETTVLWDRATGEPACKAIVWQDVRSKPVTDPLQPYAEEIFSLSGLQPSPYYSAGKAAYAIGSSPELRSKLDRGQLCIGTVDSYLLYRLTSGKSFLTDMTNACRTQLFDIEKLTWSQELTEMFNIPVSALAERVLPADSGFGLVDSIPELAGIPVLAMLGDSHASLFGHGCTAAGTVKTSFGTGSSIMMNIGGKPMWSSEGLSTSIGFAFGGQLCYVLEGNVTCSADTLVWLKDSLHLINSMDELDEAGNVPDTGGVYLVPAFAGLGAPWFCETAKAVIYGMNRGTERAHVLRAALASIAHQNADVLDAIYRTTGIPVTSISADGGGCANSLLMQMQSDLVPCNLAVSMEKDLTLRGIALMAGISCGIFNKDFVTAPQRRMYTPQMEESVRIREREGWADAVKRCM